MNNNKVYLFGSNEKSNIIIILHENGEQELKIEYEKNIIFNPHSFYPCFNTNNILYTTVYKNICLISNMSDLKIDKHMNMDNNNYIVIDYYDNILLSHYSKYNYNYGNNSIDVYSPDLEKISKINTKCYYYSNIIYYDKSLYYINGVGNLCKEEYI